MKFKFCRPKLNIKLGPKKCRQRTLNPVIERFIFNCSTLKQEKQSHNTQKDAKNNDLLELCPSFAQIIEALQNLSSRAPLRALFIDYGPETTEFGDTLQALKRHKKVGVFSDPGQTDLTARVDFAAFSELAEKAKLKTFGPLSQRAFLSKLGIELRAVALTRNKPESRPKILRQLHRLMDEQEMGSLFKVICIAPNDTEESLGF